MINYCNEVLWKAQNVIFKREITKESLTYLFYLTCHYMDARELQCHNGIQLFGMILHNQFTFKLF